MPTILNSKTIDLSETIAEIRGVQQLVSQITADASDTEPRQWTEHGVLRTTYFSMKDGNQEFSVERWDYPAATHQDWHTHAEGKSGHIVSGLLTLHTEDGARTLQPFDPFYIAPNQPHRFSTMQGASAYVFVLTGHPAHGGA